MRHDVLVEKSFDGTSSVGFDVAGPELVLLKLLQQPLLPLLHLQSTQPFDADRHLNLAIRICSLSLTVWYAGYRAAWITDHLAVALPFRLASF